MIFAPEIAVNVGEFYGEKLEEIFPLISSLNINYVELPTPMVLETGLRETQELLTKYNLRVSAINSWAHLAVKENSRLESLRVEKSIEVSKALRVGRIIIYYGGDERSLKLFKANIKPFIKEESIIFALENEFSGDATAEAHSLKRIMEELPFPNLKINFDPANFYMAGEEPFPYAFHLLRDFINYIHLKDVRKVGTVEGKGKGTSYEEEGRKIWIGGKAGDTAYLSVPLGEGAINYEGFFQAMKEERYCGFLSLEPHTTKRRIWEILRKNIKYIREHLG
ncbi:MAG: sugar phosphate isomerase/epimerase family protein [bacterium]